MDDRPIILNRDPKEKQIFIGNANYHFDNKTYTLGGLISVILFVISTLTFCGGIYSSYKVKGEGPLILGALGFIGMLIAVSGFIVGIMSFKEEDKNYMLSKIGVVLNFILLLLWGCIYLIGI